MASFTTEWGVFVIETFLCERIVRVQRNDLQRFTTRDASSGNDLCSTFGVKV